MNREEEVEWAWAHHTLHSPGRRRHRQRIWSAMRAGLAEAQGWRCCWCALEMNIPDDPASLATIEHIIPMALGGQDDLENIAVACITCNRSRPSTTDEIWRLTLLFGLLHPDYLYRLLSKEPTISQLRGSQHPQGDHHG